MNQYKCAVFDLDGTLINTITDLGNACAYILRQHGYACPWTEADYKRFVGNGIKKLVERVFRHELNEETLQAYTDEFIAYYQQHSLDNTDAYDGIREALSALKAKGIRTAVVTNKAEPSAVYIVESIFGKDAFDVIVGQRDGLPVKPAPDGVWLALKRLECEADEALYFGDSNVDMQTAHNAGLDAVGVTWGFRSREELLALSPAAVIDEPSEIVSFFN